MMIRKCQKCHKEFKIFNCRAKRGGKFCSHFCYGKSKIGISWGKHSQETKKEISKIHKGKITSEETRKKMSATHKRIGSKPPVNRGENHYAWKGGVNSLNTQIRHSIEYRLWRKSIFQRDNWACVWCGKKDRTIEADHIKPFALFPELRFAIDNGRTLCHKCHKTTDTYGKSIEKLENEQKKH